MFDRAVHVLRLRWRSLARRREVEAQLADEIAYHLAEEADRRAGARRGARRGRARGACAPSAASSAPRTPAATRAAPCSSRASPRICATARASLLRQPAYAVPAVLTLALGIGATTAVFALVDGILVSRLPYPAPDRLVGANVVYPGGGLEAARGARCATMDVAAYADGHAFTLAGDGPAVRVSGATVSAELFGVLGVDAGARPDVPRRRGSGGARRRRAAERRAVAVALRRRSRRRRPHRSPSTGVRARSSACCRRPSISRRGAPSSGCRCRSIRATPCATGPATSCRSSGGCGPASPRPAPRPSCACSSATCAGCSRGGCPTTWNRDLGDRAAADRARRRRRGPRWRSCRPRCWSCSSSPAPTSPISACRAPRPASARSASAPRSAATPRPGGAPAADRAPAARGRRRRLRLRARLAAARRC